MDCRISHQILHHLPERAGIAVDDQTHWNVAFDIGHRVLQGVAGQGKHVVDQLIHGKLLPIGAGAVGGDLLEAADQCIDALQIGVGQCQAFTLIRGKALEFGAPDAASVGLLQPTQLILQGADGQRGGTERRIHLVGDAGDQQPE